MKRSISVDPRFTHLVKAADSEVNINGQTMTFAEFQRMTASKKTNPPNVKPDLADRPLTKNDRSLLNKAENLLNQRYPEDAANSNNQQNRVQILTQLSRYQSALTKQHRKEIENMIAQLEAELESEKKMNVLSKPSTDYPASTYENGAINITTSGNTQTVSVYSDMTITQQEMYDKDDITIVRRGFGFN